MIRAGFGIRLGAALIDAVIIYGLLFVGSLLTVPIMVFAAARAGGGAPPYTALTGLGVGAVFCVAYTLTEVFGGRCRQADPETANRRGRRPVPGLGALATVAALGDQVLPDAGELRLVGHHV